MDYADGHNPGVSDVDFQIAGFFYSFEVGTF
jgi:hypothetical protein